MHRKIILLGLILALLSVLLGAFGAHALKNIVESDKVAIFETGVRYQFMHGLALILLALFNQQNLTFPQLQKSINRAAQFFLLGCLFFCGSLYLLTLQPLVSFNYSRIVGPVTPIGGLLFMLGWASWIRLIWKHKVDK
ncbi:MAG: hypothetical protein RI940_1175 [Bacteroidota bacterium]|jgi:uncharacterized membrane protein YgdD (TMEM256/DUF423 family)